MRCEKSLFTNIKRQGNKIKINLLFKKFTNFHGQITRQFLGFRKRNFQSIVFI